MQQTKFIFISFVCLVQLLISLHSSIVTYVEQQYHNFSESQNIIGVYFEKIYQATILQNNTIYAHAHTLSEHIEKIRQAIFSFEPNPEEEISPAPLSRHTPNKTDSIKHSHITPHKEQVHTPSIPTLTQNSNSANDMQTTQTPKEEIKDISPHNTPLEETPTPSTQNAENNPTDNIIESNPAKTLPPAPSKPTQNQPMQQTQPALVQNPTIPLQAGEEVLLIGDSMMQGVAPYVQKILKTQNIHATNLSKHSTGLTYKHYFNWEVTTNEALDKNPNIALVVVLLGANDPWGMKKVAFKTAAWEEIYIARIEEIIAAAQSHGASVVWYEVPSVRDNTLNEKITYLNNLYERVVRERGEYFLRTNGFITQDGKYSSFIKNAKGKSVLVRSDDGVHFTSAGYKIMGNILLQNLKIESNIDSTISNTQTNSPNKSAL